MGKNNKKQGVLFSIQDKTGNILHNFLISIENLSEAEEYQELILKMDEVLQKIFQKNNVEMFPISDYDLLEGKLTYPKAYIFLIELFYDYHNNFNSDLFEKIIKQIKEGNLNYLPSLTTGAVVRGIDFFNQEKFIGNIWKTLNQKNIILTAPRRFGKTSILFNLLDNPKNGFCSVHFDFEKISTPQSFVAEFIVGLKRNKWINDCKKICSVVNGSFKDKNEQEINKFKDDLKAQIKEKEDWQKKWQEVSNALCESSLKMLFIFDEFSWMLENFLELKYKFEEEKRKEKRKKASLDELEKEANNKLKEAQDLISLLHETIINSKKSKFILTGSTLLKRVFREIKYKHESEFLKIFSEKKLSHLREEDAYEFIQILLFNIGIRPNKELVKEILNLIGSPIPFFLQLLIFEIEKGLLRMGEKVTTENIRNVYRERLIGTECKVYFKDYYEHLKHYTFSGPYSMHGIKSIFSEIASNEKNFYNKIKKIFKEKCQECSDDDFKRIIEYLEDEFYLKEEKGKFVFTNNVMRDWWLRHSQYMD